MNKIKHGQTIFQKFAKLYTDHKNNMQKLYNAKLYSVICMSLKYCVFEISECNIVYYRLNYKIRFVLNFYFTNFITQPTEFQISGLT